MKLLTVLALSLASYAVGVAVGPLSPAPERKPTIVAAADLLAKLDSGQVAKVDVYVSPRSAVVIDRAGRRFSAVETSDSELALFQHARRFETPIAIHPSGPGLAVRVLGSLGSRST
jgi:hypothetical protein